MPDAGSRAVIGDLVTSKLAVHLGPHVARIAVKKFSKVALDCEPEELTRAHVPELIEALRPMLAVMVGKDPSRVLLDEIARDCR